MRINSDLLDDLEEGILSLRTDVLMLRLLYDRSDVIVSDDIVENYLDCARGYILQHSRDVSFFVSSLCDSPSNVLHLSLMG